MVAWAGWGFGIGTLTVIAPMFSLADPGLWIAAALILRRRRPEPWAAVLAGTVALGIIWSANPAVTALAAARVLSLATVGAWLIRNWDARAFAVGVVLAWGLQIPYLVYGMIDPSASWVAAGRQVGLTRYATLLGTGAYFVHLAIPKSPRILSVATWAVGAVALAASGSRAPAGALGVHAVVSGSWRNVVVVGFTAALFLATAYNAGTSARMFSVSAIERDIVVRIATAAPDRVSAQSRDNVYRLAGFHLRATEPGEPGELVAVTPSGDRVPVGVSKWRAQGVGAGAYLDANPWPRPHNIYSILWHELGVLAVVPVALFGLAVYRRRINLATVLSVAALGLLDDTLISQAEGHFILAGVLVLSVTGGRRTAS